jgi:hypothetical protein
VQFQTSALLAFESALTFDQAIKDPTRRTWLRLVTALAKYLTAEYAIRSCRAALELIGGNGYTSDYPIARIYRDAQVLTVWEGPANIQALELLRLLNPKYQGAVLYEHRVRAVIAKVPHALSTLRSALENRLDEDLAAMATVTRDQQSSQRYARKLLHRMSETLGFALASEVASDAHADGNELPYFVAVRYLEEIEPPKIGGENGKARDAALQLIDSALNAQPVSAVTSV